MTDVNRIESRRILRRLKLEFEEAYVITGNRGVRQLLEVWRHGFVARQGILFDFDRYGYDAFLSEFERKRKLPRLNKNTALFKDKLLAFLFFREIGTPNPRVFAFADRRGQVFLGGEGAHDGIEGLLRRQGKLVVKPRDGAHGRGILVLEDRGGTTLANGTEVASISNLIDDRVIVSEFVEQHDYAREIFPGAANTLRVISVREHATGEPFVVSAIHRFGTRRSQPVDNMELGGLSAGVDIATGTLGALAAIPGAYLRHHEPLAWLDKHPDTGVRVTGTLVPHWDDIVRELNRTMAALPEYNWVGWDVLVTAQGFSVIEGNTGPGITFQVHGPLLQDDRVRALFEARGVLSRMRRPKRRRGRQPAGRRERFSPSRAGVLVGAAKLRPNEPAV